MFDFFYIAGGIRDLQCAMEFYQNCSVKNSNTKVHNLVVHLPFIEEALVGWKRYSINVELNLSLKVFSEYSHYFVVSMQGI